MSNVNSHLRQWLKLNILNVNEVAEKLQLSKQRVYGLVRSEELLPFKENLFLLSDVEDYIALKNKEDRYFTMNVTGPQFYCKSGITSDSISFFEEHVSEMDEIVAIFIYFDKIDAVINGFYIPSEHSVGNLNLLDVPHMVLRDKQGHEMWLGGCNCGYGGEGPHGSESILMELGLSSELIQHVFYHRVVNYFRNEDGSFDHISHDSPFERRPDPYTGEANLYIHRGRLTLIQSDRLGGTSETTLDRYRQFIPNPVEAFMIPKKEQAIELGYAKPDFEKPRFLKTFQLIIRDASGRQLWLNPGIYNLKSISNQQRLEKLLESCGFMMPKQSIGQQMLNWLNSNIRNVPPEIIHLKK